MRMGSAEHGLEERRDKRRKLLDIDVSVREKFHRLHLRSDELGLEGVVDLLVEGSELVVVERKYAEAPRRPFKGHLYQVAAYAMLVEYALGRPVRRARIEYLKSRRSFEVEVDDHLRRHVLWTVRRIREIIDEGVDPGFAPRPGCGSCGYRRLCQQV